MSETANATVQQEQQQSPDEALRRSQAKTQVQPIEFAEAPQGAATAAGGQFDILLDMEVPVAVLLGSTQIPVRRLLQLGPGAVLRLDKPIEAPADLYLKESKFAEADVVVVDNRFAVRIREITGAGVANGRSEA